MNEVINFFLVSYQRILPLLPPLISLILNLIKNFINGSIQDKKIQENDKINIINSICYDDERGKNNIRNSYIFFKLTHKTAPIHTINLIMNCRDPAEAIYIFSKAPNFIYIDNDKLCKPKSLLFFGKVINIILIVLSLTGFVLGFYLILLLFDPDISTIRNNDSNTWSIIVAITIAFVVILFVLNYIFLKKAILNIELIKRTENFYLNYQERMTASKFQGRITGRMKDRFSKFWGKNRER